nr:MetaGeneMark_Unknown Function [uncultured bacterium]
MTTRDSLGKQAAASISLLLLLLFGATAEAQVASEGRVTLKGQLVCSLCWFEADRKETPYGTPADIQCAKDCAEKDIPPAVAVKSGEEYKLYVIDGKQFKENKEKWLDYIGKEVQATGRVRVNKGQRIPGR